MKDGLTDRSTFKRKSLKDSTLKRINAIGAARNELRTRGECVKVVSDVRERWLSGLKRTPGKREWAYTPPGVRISLSPPNTLLIRRGPSSSPRRVAKVVADFV